jgi:hypothetical protein
VRTDPAQVAQCRASRFFSAVRRCKAEVLRARLARRFDRASVGQCIPPGKHPPVRVHLAWDQPFRHRELHVRAAVPALRRGVPASAMFRAE